MEKGGYDGDKIGRVFVRFVVAISYVIFNFFHHGDNDGDKLPHGDVF